jgi:hypothetical protein
MTAIHLNLLSGSAWHVSGCCSLNRRRKAAAPRPHGVSGTALQICCSGPNFTTLRHHERVVAARSPQSADSHIQAATRHGELAASSETPASSAPPDVDDGSILGSNSQVALHHDSAQLTGQSDLQRLISYIPFRRLAIWAIVLFMAWQLSDFFGVRTAQSLALLGIGLLLACCWLHFFCDLRFFSCAALLLLLLEVSTALSRNDTLTHRRSMVQRPLRMTAHLV